MSNPLLRQVALLRTPIGRARIARDYFNGAWHILKLAAMLYRLTIVRRVRFVTVVGSQGKTTTARTTAAALDLADDPSRAHNHNCLSHLAAGVLRIRPGDSYAVLEVGIAGKGVMRTYAKFIRPDITVVTSISSEHHRSFGSLEATRMEKAEMVGALPSSGLAVLNGDDPNVLWMRERTKARVVTYGFSPTCVLRASGLVYDWPVGMRFNLHAGGMTWEARTRLIGRHYIYSILAAIVVGLEAGRSVEAILADLSLLPPTPGRLEPIRLSSGAIVLCDDFKATLETIDAALDCLAEIPARRKIVILGEVDDSPENVTIVHRRLANRIAETATGAIFLGSSKTCREYAAGAVKAGIPRESSIKAGRNLQTALKSLPGDLGEGDVILVKGRTDQRLRRIVLTLMGYEVRCEIVTCPAKAWMSCDRCGMLGRGWRGLRVEA